jgi:pimeloyl-ACP methyl ester carboxylesterase
MKNFLNLVSSFTREYYLAITYPFVAWVVHPKVYHHPSPKGTIVLVGCWFNSNVYHNIWVSYLEKAGFRTYLLDLPFAREDFDTTTKRLAQFIARHRLKNYTIVGISSGVLVCWNYLTTYKKWSEVHRFISIGGPVQGTITAWLITFTSKGRAMVPGSAFIKKLHKEPFPKYKMITLTAKHDELVPYKYAKLDGVRNYRLSGWGHNSFHLSSKDTYQIIAKIAGGSISNHKVTPKTSLSPAKLRDFQGIVTPTGLTPWFS